MQCTEIFLQQLFCSHALCIPTVICEACEPIGDFMAAVCSTVMQ